ncbi:MAG: bile acid:sodium symporter family protein [Limisphaerales bacterium]
MSNFLRTCTNLFPVWVVACGVLAMFQPTWFTWFDKPKIIWGLGVIMLGMGVTLKFEDFAKVAKMPLPILTGFAAQYLIMPFLGWAVAKLTNLPPEFAVGVILVSCCPGGTASNVVTYLAKANLPLSLLMTMCSTFTAAAATPVLVEFYAGAIVPVPFWGLVQTTATVVLLPIIAGLIIHHLFPKAVHAVSDVAPLISVITIALICGSIIGGRIEALKEHGLSLLFAIVLLHSLAFLLGYFFARLFGYEELVRRTVAIEVGMQNSGLGTVLAQKHFPGASGVSMAAVPCAISATTHCVIGSILAAIWRTRLPKEIDKTPPADEPDLPAEG